MFTFNFNCRLSSAKVWRTPYSVSIISFTLQLIIHRILLFHDGHERLLTQGDVAHSFHALFAFLLLLQQFLLSRLVTTTHSLSTFHQYVLAKRRDTGAGDDFGSCCSLGGENKNDRDTHHMHRHTQRHPGLIETNKISVRTTSH